eukprot:g11251.t1
MSNQAAAPPTPPPRKYLSSRPPVRRRNRPKLFKKRSIWDAPAVHEFLLAQNAKTLHARRIYKYLLRTPNSSLRNLDSIVDFPVRVLPALQRTFSLFTSKVVSAVTSKDQATTKLLVELQDGLRIETVIIRHGAVTARNPGGEKRTTLCVSSQVGCKMGCTFCATGTMGEIGNLTAGEILEQLIFARQFAEVRNIVFMGMGEPMNNYESVKAAVEAMVDPHRFKLSPNRVTVSTVGVPGPMRRFVDDLPKVNLALSLHAPTQDLRKRFVPSASGFPLHKLMDMVDFYLDKTKRKLLVEYVVLKGTNDSDEVAEQLGTLLRGKNVTVNLIPYNSTDVHAPHEAPDTADVLRFQRVLADKYKLSTTVRKEMGADIASACGQLVVSRADQGKVPQTKDIEDVAGSVPGSPARQSTLLEDTLGKNGQPRLDTGIPLWPGLGSGKVTGKVSKKTTADCANPGEGKCPMRKYSTFERIMQLELSDLFFIVCIMIAGMYLGTQASFDDSGVM